MTTSSTMHPSEPACPLCGRSVPAPWFLAHDRLYGRPVPGSAIWRCDNCGLVFLWPVPSDLTTYYGADYGPYRSTEASGDIAYGRLQRYGLRRKATYVRDLDAPPGPLLDVGCAAGHFLSVSAEISDRSHLGTDLTLAPLRRRWSPNRVAVWQGDGLNLPVANHSLAIVTMWHVLEHLASPHDALDEVRRVLKPGGVLVLALPLVDSLAAHVFGQYWSGYDMPRHLFVYSRSTIHALLTRCGFAAAEVPGVVMGFNSAKVSTAMWLRAALARLAGYIPVRWTPPLAAALLTGASRAFGLLGLRREDVGVFVARPTGQG